MVASNIGERLQRLHTALLCDVIDTMGFRSSSIGAGIRPLRSDMKVAGRAFTMKCVPVDQVPDEPYVELLAGYESMQAGDMIVLETGDRVSAMWGELLTIAAMSKGARGVVMDGMVRDVDQILEIGFPVFAAGYSPLDSAGRQEVVAHNINIRCGDAEVRPGDWMLCDVMGAIVIPAELVEEAIDRAEAKDAGESVVRAELLRGDDIGEVFRRHGVL